MVIPFIAAVIRDVYGILSVTFSLIDAPYVRSTSTPSAVPDVHILFCEVRMRSEPVKHVTVKLVRFF